MDIASILLSGDFWLYSVRLSHTLTSQEKFSEHANKFSKNPKNVAKQQEIILEQMK